MNILELFSGSKSFSKVAHGGGHKVYTVDNVAAYDPDYCVDILEIDLAKIPFKPDFIWASPPCTTFSVASIGYHWNIDNTPKTGAAVVGVQIIEKTIAIINELQPKYWLIENPRGKLRKLPVMAGLKRYTVSYCQYGDTRMKPTDIWTNLPMEKIRALCRPGAMCHESAPRGSKTGTQGITGAYGRSVVPEELCRDIVEELEALV